MYFQTVITISLFQNIAASNDTLTSITTAATIAQTTTLLTTTGTTTLPWTTTSTTSNSYESSKQDIANSTLNTSTETTTACEWSIPTTPCGSGCIRNDRLTEGILTCRNGSECALVDPLPVEIQELIDEGIVGIDSYLEGCYDSYKSDDGGGSSVTLSTTAATTVASTAIPSGDDGTEVPTANAAAAFKYPIGVCLVGWYSYITLLLL
jgi:hypothetical protein